MASTYLYQLRGTDGALRKGSVQAANQREAIERVHKIGGTLLDLRQAKESAGSKDLLAFLPRSVSLKDKIVLTQQLAVMLHAGIPLIQALRGLGEETPSRTIRTVVATLVTDIEDGMPFSQALTKHPRMFSSIYVEMVKSAEQTGHVAEVLEKLTHQQEKEYDLRGKVKGALMYPAIICVLLVGVVVLVIVFIIPKLTGLFAESGTALPPLTQFLIATSDLFVHQWYLLLGGILALVGGLRLVLATQQGRETADRLKLGVPVLGNFLKKSYLARFAQTFASLSEAGIPVLEAFKTLRGVVGNTVYEREVDRIAAEVANGGKMSVAIRKSKLFPGMVGQLVSVGEQSGDLSGIFTVLGEFFEKEVDGMAKNLSTVLEPLIMLVMAVVIGFILVAVLQPIYGLVNAV